MQTLKNTELLLKLYKIIAQLFSFMFNHSVCYAFMKSSQYLAGEREKSYPVTII